MEQLLLAKFDYYIDKSDPDVVILRRKDGAFVAAPLLSLPGMF